MKSITETQASVDKNDSADEQLKPVRKDNDSLEGKLINFILGMTPAQVGWVRQLQTVDWAAEDPKNKTWHLFAEANAAGIRRSVAYPLVKNVVEAHDVSITPQELAARAHGAYQPAEVAPEPTRRAPKSNFTPGMVIPKVRILQ